MYHGSIIEENKIKLSNLIDGLNPEKASMMDLKIGRSTITLKC